VFAINVATACSQDTPSPGQNQTIECSATSSTPITLTMRYGTEKQKWIEDAVQDFNRRNLKACDGPIHVNTLLEGSGESMQKILQGEQTDIWSPAGRIWLSLLNAEWHKTSGHDRDLIGATSVDSPALVNTPIVVAMWKSQAQALSSKPFGWSDILKLSSQGWAAYGHPEWKNFQFAHTLPNISNSGLWAVIAEYLAALDQLGKKNGLGIAEVQDPQIQGIVASAESSTIYYGESTGFFAQQMCEQGPNYLHAAVLYESLVVEMNEGKFSPKCQGQIVALYPKEGTVYSDHPFAIVQGPQMTNAKRTSALRFYNFLHSSEQQQKAILYGFRPADRNLPITTPIDSNHGVDPQQPKTTLPIPSVDIVQAILDSWDHLRRKGAIMLLLDTSGSMNEPVTTEGIPKIAAAKQGLKEFIGKLSDDDQVGLATFNTTMQVQSPVSPLAPKRQELYNKIAEISASGDTLLYQSIADQIDALATLPPNYIKAIVVLSDGNDTISQLTLDQLLKKIDLNTGNKTRIFPIAYGDQSNSNIEKLQQIAQATGGRQYTGTPQDIQQVYDNISQFFASYSHN
jgi:Ca-activated chloride channel homolog